MAYRRFASAAGPFVTPIKTTAIALATVAAAAGLAGCATAPPFTVEEQLWFDKATGTDITNVPPGLRMHEAVFYPHGVRRVYQAPPPETEAP